MGYLSRFKLSAVSWPDGFRLRQVVDFLAEELPAEPELPAELRVAYDCRVVKQRGYAGKVYYELQGQRKSAPARADRETLIRLGRAIANELARTDTEAALVYRRDSIKNILTGKSTTKWYDFQADMRRVAARFPDVVFQLSVEGEDREDLTRHYYHGDWYEAVRGVVSYARPQMLGEVDSEGRVNTE